MLTQNDNIIKRFQDYIASHDPQDIEHFPPLTVLELESAEGKLGFILPELLREIYLRVGRVRYYSGAGWDFLGWVNRSNSGDEYLDDYSIINWYEDFKANAVIPTSQDPLGEWPDQLIPFCTWSNDYLFYCVDCSQPPFAVFKYNQYVYEYDRLKLHSPSFERWMKALLKKENVWFPNDRSEW